MNAVFQRITPRDINKAVEKAYRHSRRIAWLRNLLPVALGAALLGLIAIPIIGRLGYKSTLPITPPNIVIDNLRIQGSDDMGQVWGITAKKAVRVMNSSGLIDLEQPTGAFKLSSGTILQGSASNGRMEEATRRLWLGGGVAISDDKGNSFKTDYAWLDTKTKEAWGDRAVNIKIDNNEITGQGFKVIDKGVSLIIIGPASAKISLDSLKSDNKDGS